LLQVAEWSVLVLTLGKYQIGVFTNSTAASVASVASVGSFSTPLATLTTLATMLF